MHLWAQADNGFGTLQVQEATGVERNLERDTFMVVRNVSGVTIPKMRCVCFTGTSSGVPTVDLADAGPYGLTSGNLAEAITTADIAHNAYGRICLKGLVTELNTSAFVDGDLLYLSTNGSGSLTTTAPAHPYRVQRVGRITQVHPVKGTIFFNPQGDLSYWSSNRVTVLGDPTSDPNVQGPTIISLSNVNGSLDLRGFHTGNRQLTLPDATGSLALLAGADKQIQFNDGGVSGGDADFTWDKTLNELFVAGDVKLNATTVSPATPGTDQLKIFARKLSNRILPAFIGPAGLDSPLQPSLFSNVCMMWLPLTGTSMTLWGGSTTNVGTLSNPTLATTNLQSAARRVRFATAAVANSFAGARGAQTTVWRGNAAGLGGFYFACRFSMSTNLANVRAFVGLNGNTAALGNADPSTIATDIIGVSLNSADANWTMITNDNAGACTTTNLGASFVKSTTAVYELRMFAKPNDTEIYWQMDRLDAAGSQSGSFLNTNLPRNTVFLNPYIWITNNAVASSAQIEMMRLYIESDL
jgi:hypothetical protein